MFKEKLTTYEVITLVISIIGLTSLIFLVIQTWQLGDTLESTVLTNISAREHEMNTVFVEYPELQPYFFSGTPINESDPDYARVLAIARTRLSFISTFYDQSTYVNDLRNANNPTWRAWTNYIQRLFSTSPIMCQQLRDTRDDYTPDFVAFVGAGCPRF